MTISTTLAKMQLAERIKCECEIHKYLRQKLSDEAHSELDALAVGWDNRKLEINQARLGTGEKPIP